MKLKVVIPTIRNSGKVIEALNCPVNTLEGSEGTFKTIIMAMEKFDYNVIFITPDDLIPFRDWKRALMKHMMNKNQMIFDASTEKYPEGFCKANNTVNIEEVEDGFYSEGTVSMPHIYTLRLAIKIVNISKSLKNIGKSGSEAGAAFHRIFKSLGYHRIFHYNKELFHAVL